MKVSVTNNLWAVLFGIVTALVISMGASALMAVLIGGGMVPIASANIIAWGVTVVASLLGAVVCAGKAGEKRLPLCLATGAVYLLLVFVLRGLMFGNVAERPWIIPLCVLLGSILGALASSKKKRRKY